MANIIIGTAGHIDHGKSTLIKALTGIATDTTEEEIQRGMSINLGFAYFDLPSGRRVGIIDVPGHERFIKNMLAGAQGINMILLVIDANEGVMPQTREHVNILNLLGIEDYIVVLSKADLVEDEMLDLMEDDIREQFEGTPIETASIVRVDSLSGRGLPELVNNIDRLADRIRPMNLTAEPRLNIDRIFSVKGFGTVVTGTLLEGTIRTDQDLMVYPAGIPVKIRNIQVHEKNVDLAQAGQRTALNLSGVKVTDLQRGDILTTEGNLSKSYIVDARIRVLPDYKRPLKLWDRVRVYMGTDEIMARAVPLGTEEIPAGGEGFIQLRLEEEIAAKPGDRIILRAYSPMVTLGGGQILDPATVKHGRFDETILRGLELRGTNDVDAVIQDFLMNSDQPLVSEKEILDNIQADKSDLQDKLSAMKTTGSVLQLGGLYIGSDRLEEMRKEFLRILNDYHQKSPLKAGMPREELKSRIKFVAKGKPYDLILERLVEEGTIRVFGSLAKAPNFEVVYTKEQKKLRDELETALLDGAYAPPSLKELCPDKKCLAVIDSMEDCLVRLDQDIVIHRRHYEAALALLQEHAKAHGSIALADFRDLLGTSRKYAVALLDYFDKIGLTQRQGEVRILTGKEV
ncbi:selenocysteine-specific translation elongation factor [Proteiniclasticum sp. QWL-01]|uniref:selenocysteine-specific translation elongation factor n=1 Tax=Proteiniclasticum sp. QWL-01 TaxID=3036945 RepID=UPI0024110787|nr:selenocysteine-specific translation elongation factor [Proteiniclasticum sp. QWL-01]WFF73132.1 selenocysteine-specific translation elongation factor [Proteiniclasticum sp. QWL-01]